jgi:hypothetical protein
MKIYIPSFSELISQFEDTLTRDGFQVETVRDLPSAVGYNRDIVSVAVHDPIELVTNYEESMPLSTISENKHFRKMKMRIPVWLDYWEECK